jgi:hypothetical protein
MRRRDAGGRGYELLDLQIFVPGESKLLNPPTIIMRSMPHETTPIIEFCWRIFHRFSGQPNLRDTTINEARSTTRGVTGVKQKIRVARTFAGGSRLQL